MSVERNDSKGFFDRAMEKFGYGTERAKKWDYVLDRIPPGAYVDLLMHGGDVVRAVRARSLIVHCVRTGEVIDRDTVKAWRRA